MLVSSVLAGCGTGNPQAKFTAVPPNGYAPLDVQFTDKSAGNISSWEWDFNGDGTIDSINQNGNYTYENPGNFTVSLTVRGPKGNSTEVKEDCIQVSRCPYLADFTIETLPANCSLQGNTTSCRGITTIQFADKSTGNITAWYWDFGDNKTSTEQNPKHIYTRNVNYSVTLTITTPECKDTLTKSDYIKVSGCG